MSFKKNILSLGIVASLFAAVEVQAEAASARKELSRAEKIAIKQRKKEDKKRRYSMERIHSGRKRRVAEFE